MIVRPASFVSHPAFVVLFFSQQVDEQHSHQSQHEQHEPGLAVAQRLDASGQRALFTTEEVQQLIDEAVRRRENELTQLFDAVLQERLTGKKKNSRVAAVVNTARHR